jgi:hypothetical protein
LQFIQDYATGIIEIKLDAYCIGTGRDIESTIARDEYFAALSDLQFRNGLLNVQPYFDTIKQLYSFPTAQSNPEALVKSAEARITFHNNVLLYEDTLNLSWEALSTALVNLTTASKLPDVENLAAVHVLRGDVEMLRYQMSQRGFAAAKKSAEVLLKNAEVFYRGGKNVARAAAEQGVEGEGAVKEGLVKGLRGDGLGMQGVFAGMLAGSQGDVVEKMISEAVEDGVVTREQLQGLGFAA